MALLAEIAPCLIEFDINIKNMADRLTITLLKWAGPGDASRFCEVAD
jgi:hypothetical protein